MNFLSRYLEYVRTPTGVMSLLHLLNLCPVSLQHRQRGFGLGFELEDAWDSDTNSSQACILHSSRHYLDFNGFELSQVALLVESPRINGVASSSYNVEQENSWKVATKVIMRAKKEVMVPPPCGWRRCPGIM